MSGYIELNRTGFAPFDDALSLIEEAGDAYYHTSQWIDDGWNGEKPYLVQINESIEFAAKSYLSLQDENKDKKNQLEVYLKHIKAINKDLKFVHGWDVPKDIRIIHNNSGFSSMLSNFWGEIGQRIKNALDNQTVAQA